MHVHALVSLWAHCAVLAKISAALIARKKEAEQRAKQQEEHIKKQVGIYINREELCLNE